MSEQGHEQVNRPDAPTEPTLASILAEYKSEAYVRNERRLSKAELEKRAEAILAEMRQSLDQETAQPNAGQTDVEASTNEAADEDLRIWDKEAKKPAAQPDESAPAEPEPEAEPETASETEAEPEPETAQAAEAASGETQEEPPSPAEPAPSRRERRRQAAQREAAQLAEKQAAQPELTPVEAARRYAAGISSLQWRTVSAFLLCALLAALMYMYGRGTVLPPILNQETAMAKALTGGQLLVVLLGADVMLRGISALLFGRPGSETLVAAANLAALADGLMIALGHAAGVGLPYCAVAGLTLAFALLGSRMRRSAYRDTFRTMRAAKIPTVVTAEPELVDEGMVLYKRLGSAKGFVRKVLEQDQATRLFRKLSPLLLILSAVLSLAAAWLSGSGIWLHCFAGLSAAAATMTAALAFNRPFSLIARRLAGYGAVLAGWRGAAEIRRAVGLIVRDLDIFPENTVTLSGMKVLSGAQVEKVVSYTGSMILASGSGLKRTFGELMRQYAATLYRTTEFTCNDDGGISAFIGRDQVMVGSSAYMNLMGIRVPASVDVAGAVYTAIDRELSGVFIVSYTPLELVKNALVGLNRSRIRPIYAIRDFNISPLVLQNKFRLGGERVYFLPAETRYQLSADMESERTPAALMSREGLSHYVEVARGGRRLVRTVQRALAMTVLGAVLGMGIVFLACARGAFSAVSAGRLLISMLLWAFATLMIADSADGN